MENTSKTSDNNNKNISDIVKLKQKLKKWKQANSSSSSTTIISNNNNSNTSNTNSNNSSNKKGSLSRSNSIKEGITFLRRTLSLGDISTSGVSTTTSVPKGFLAVQVGDEMKRFVIPTHYLGHKAFSALLKEAEEEFGFQQEGILRIPCEVAVFEGILKSLDVKSNSSQSKQAVRLSRKDGSVCGSSESHQTLSHSRYPPSPMCR